MAPIPFLTVTVEAGASGDELHVHAGGQGFWVARMAARLGVRTVLCAAFGGETGRVLPALVEAEGIEVRGVGMQGANGAYVHDRRGGQRRPMLEFPSPTLSRHELDELYGLALTSGIEAGVVALTGVAHASGALAASLPPSAFRRLARDLRANGAVVVADLAGDALAGALAGGIDLLKVSHREVIEGGYADGESEAALVRGIGRLRNGGARDVLLTRAGKPALAAVGGRVIEVVPPRCEAVEPRGPGDAMTAAVAAALAWGLDVESALRLGAAAGALNVTRRGLGTGRRDDIERLASRVLLRPLDADAAAPARASSGRARRRT
ncbi:MAG TPA: PfkB family carbohydrate kinase [Thermodesulfobacteriota bacterium]